MLPEIGLLGVTQYDWPTFRSTMAHALGKRPDLDINKLPIELSNDALILLNIAAFWGFDIKNPLDTLRNLPSYFKSYLSYQFFIACNKDTWDEIHITQGITFIEKTLPEGVLLLCSGSLDSWYSVIVNNLNRDWEYTHEARLIFCKLMVCFERRGLHFLFEDYKKKVLQDYTFLLEKKK